MKILFLFTGKTDDGWIRQGLDLYMNRLKHYTSMDVIEIPALKQSGKVSIEEQKTAEGEMQLSKISASDRLILLDEKGKEYSSENFAKWLAKQQGAGYKRIVFLAGGPFGFSGSIYERANEKISLSQMTFSHQMIRPLLAEQVYRAFTILRGEKYHHS